MKLVKIEILPARDSDVVRCLIRQQRRKGGTWEEIERHIVSSGTPEASRVMLLEDDERVIVEGGAMRKTIIDHEQMAAMEVDDPNFKIESQAIVSSQPASSGFECQVGVWRTTSAGYRKPFSTRTGKPYRIYQTGD